MLCVAAIQIRQQLKNHHCGKIEGELETILKEKLSICEKQRNGVVGGKVESRGGFCFVFR